MRGLLDAALSLWRRMLQSRNASPDPWLRRLETLIKLQPRELRSYARANSDAVLRALCGVDPHGPTINASAGARMVVNLSSAHVPAFCAAAERNDPKPYKNSYDLAVGGVRLPSESRKLVDAALPLPSSSSPKDVYFGAVEVTGTGIRFYGDICLVLRRDALPDDTVVLDRNSFELLASPVRDVVDAAQPETRDRVRKDIARSWSGTWARDLATMASLKVLARLGFWERRWTVGQISQAVREDEDYIEVLKIGSFGPRDLEEARVAAADAAHDALVGTRLLHGPLPRLESLIWRHRRSSAERALRRAGVPVRFITTSGRVRT